MIDDGFATIIIERGNTGWVKIPSLSLESESSLVVIPHRHRHFLLQIGMLAAAANISLLDCLLITI